MSDRPTLDTPDVDRLSKTWAAQIADKLAVEGINEEALSLQMSALVSSDNGAVLFFLAVAVRNMASDIEADPHRPSIFTPDLILPVLTSTIFQLATHMKVIPLPHSSEDLH